MRHVIICGLLFFSIAGKCQTGDTSSITANFRNMNITQFTDELQKRTGFSFFYDAKQFDTISFNFSVSNKSLSSILETAFSSTDFFFGIDRNNRVFITWGQPVFTSLGVSRNRVRKPSAVAKQVKDSVIRSAFAGVAGVKTLESVTISAALNVKSTTMGVQSIDIKTIKQVPVLFGEADVLRAVLTLPGVTSVGESSTGFNVRGGAADQNLILFNDATVYNPSHFFGFFSAFNPDIIKTAELYKSSIPEKYGGRLSSVLDVTAREGNKKKFEGSGGIGPITARVSFEGPIDSNRTSFIVSARTTYSDWLLRSIHNDAYGNSSAAFTDANVIVSHEINSNNNIYISAYMSNDKFRLNSDTLYGYSNRNGNIKWKHIFNNKFYGLAVAGWDHYQYNISSDQNPVNAYNLESSISQGSFRTDFNYSPDNKHALSFGLNSIYYKIKPGSFYPKGSQSLVIPDNLQDLGNK